MNQSSNLEREKGLEERPSGVPYLKGKLRLLLGTAASLMVACVGPQNVETPAAGQEEATKSIDPMEYWTPEGLHIISSPGRMAVDKGGLQVIGSCASEHPYAGTVLPAHMDFYVDAHGILHNPSNNYWLKITEDITGRSALVSTGQGGQGATAMLHDRFWSIRGADGTIMQFKPGGSYTVGVYEHPYTEQSPSLPLPTAQLSTLIPDCR